MIKGHLSSDLATVLLLDYWILGILELESFKSWTDGGYGASEPLFGAVMMITSLTSQARTVLFE